MTTAALLRSLRGRGAGLWHGASAEIDTGVISAEEIFLPWVVGSDGMTVSEVLLPRLKALPGTPMQKLLGAGDGA